MIFKDRTDAGIRLAQKLIIQKNENPLVLALPRGGVPIGFEIAKKLNAPLDVLIVRKLGSPSNPEFGIGAIAPENVIVLDSDVIEYLGLSKQEIAKIEKAERRELSRRTLLYRGSISLPDIKDKTVILVDDGLATGVTARAAIRSVLKLHPKRLIVAIPVCAFDSCESIKAVVRPMKDEVICLTAPFDLSAVGYWYSNFEQVSDSEVVRLLKESQKWSRSPKTIRRYQDSEQRSYLHKINKNLSKE